MLVSSAMAPAYQEADEEQGKSYSGLGGTFTEAGLDDEATGQVCEGEDVQAADSQVLMNLVNW